MQKSESFKCLAFSLINSIACGLVLSCILVIVFGFMANNLLNNAVSELQQMQVSCSKEPNPFAAEISLDGKTFFCTVKKLERQEFDANSFVLNPAPQ